MDDDSGRLEELGIYSSGDNRGNREIGVLCENAAMATLSAREQEVFHWICEGKRDREIASILGISYRTVTVHVRSILRKLGAENRTCAAMMASRNSLMDVNQNRKEENT